MENNEVNLGKSRVVWSSTLDECLQRMEQYRGKKSNDMYDDFYHSHLDCMQTLLEDAQDKLKNSFAVIFCPDGHKNDNNSTSPLYATICKSPHWGKKEGIMLTSGMYDATKFDLDYKYLGDILKYVGERYKDTGKFEILVIDKRICGSEPKELWSKDYVRCDFDETHKIGDSIIGD